MTLDLLFSDVFTWTLNGSTNLQGVSPPVCLHHVSPYQGSGKSIPERPKCRHYALLCSLYFVPPQWTQLLLNIFDETVDFFLCSQSQYFHVTPGQHLEARCLSFGWCCCSQVRCFFFPTDYDMTWQVVFTKRRCNNACSDKGNSVLFCFLATAKSFLKF